METYGELLKYFLVFSLEFLAQNRECQPPYSLSKTLQQEYEKKILHNLLSNVSSNNVCITVKNQYVENPEFFYNFLQLFYYFQVFSDTITENTNLWYRNSMMKTVSNFYGDRFCIYFFGPRMRPSTFLNCFAL